MGCPEAFSACSIFLVFQNSNIHTVHIIKQVTDLIEIEMVSMLTLDPWKIRGYVSTLFIILVFSVPRNICFI